MRLLLDHLLVIVVGVVSSAFGFVRHPMGLLYRFIQTKFLMKQPSTILSSSLWIFILKCHKSAEIIASESINIFSGLFRVLQFALSKPYYTYQMQLEVYRNPFSTADPLQAPETHNCTFNADLSTYQCHIPLKNTGGAPLFLSITSSFGKFMQLLSDVSVLEPQSEKILSARLRPPNQIYPLEFIGISYSPSQLNASCGFMATECSFKKVKLVFSNVEFMADQEILQILKQQSTNTLANAKQMLAQTQYSSAKNIAEEAYAINRSNLDCLLIIGEAELGLLDFVKAAKTVEIFFYEFVKSTFYRALAIKAEAAIALIGTTEHHSKVKTIKNILKMLKAFVESATGIEQYDFKRISNCIQRLQKAKNQALANNEHGLFEDLIDKSIEEFQKHDEIRKSFTDVKQYQQLVQKLFQNQQKMVEETPQYAIDPINYEIYKQPVITPSGVSYDREVLLKFFAQKGPQDPLTRMPLDPATVIHNYTLKSLVRNNKNLHKWLKYEEDFTKL